MEYVFQVLFNEATKNSELFFIDAIFVRAISVFISIYRFQSYLDRPQITHCTVKKKSILFGIL